MIKANSALNPKPKKVAHLVVKMDPDPGEKQTTNRITILE